MWHATEPPEMQRAADTNPPNRLISLRTLVGASVANGVYLVAQGLVFVILTPVLWRAAGAETFGHWTVLYAAQTLLLLATLGVGQGAIKFVSQHATTESSRRELGAAVVTCYATAVAAGLVVTAGAYLLAARAADRLIAGDPTRDVVVAFRWFSAGFVPLFVHQVSRGVLLGLMRNATSGLIDVVQAVMTTGGLAVVAAAGGRLPQLIMWNVAVNVTIATLSFVAAMRAVRPLGMEPVADAGVARTVWRYSFFAWISMLGSSLFGSADRVLVSALLGPVAAGAYGIMTGAAEKLTQLTAPLVQVLFPFASNYQAAGQTRAAGPVFRHASRLVAGLLAAAAGTLLLWDRYILSLWISPAFAEQWTLPFRFLVMCYGTFSLAAPGYQVLFGLGRVQAIAVLGVVGALTSLAAIAILAPLLHLSGAALANFGYLVVLGANVAAARALGVRARDQGREIAPAVMAIAATALIGAADPGLAVRALATLTLAAVVLWQTLGNGRLATLQGVWRRRAEPVR